MQKLYKPAGKTVGLLAILRSRLNRDQWTDNSHTAFRLSRE
ncbi:hypothetical protein [Calothrix sp. NIES-2100]